MSDARAVPAWAALPLADLATAVDDTIAWLEREEARLAPARDRIDAMRAAILERMEAENATEISHPYLIVRKEKTESRPTAIISVLREGFGKLVKEGVLTEADIKPGMWLEQPEPEWRVNLTKLKTLSRFGERVRTLLTQGVHRSSPSWKLVLKRNPKVLPSAKSDATTTPNNPTPISKGDRP